MPGRPVFAAKAVKQPQPHDIAEHACLKSRDCGSSSDHLHDIQGCTNRRQGGVRLCDDMVICLGEPTKVETDLQACLDQAAGSSAKRQHAGDLSSLRSAYQLGRSWLHMLLQVDCRRQTTGMWMRCRLLVIHEVVHSICCWCYVITKMRFILGSTCRVEWQAWMSLSSAMDPLFKCGCIMYLVAVMAASCSTQNSTDPSGDWSQQLGRASSELTQSSATVNSGLNKESNHTHLSIGKPSKRDRLRGGARKQVAWYSWVWCQMASFCSGGQANTSALLSWISPEGPGL